MGNENLLPKNIRQIGDIQGSRKICIEDYVMTYIRKTESRGDGNFLGVFLGEDKKTEDMEYVFVRGIMEAPDLPEQKQNESVFRAVKSGQKKQRGATEQLRENESADANDTGGGQKPGRKEKNEQENASQETVSAQPEAVDVWSRLERERKMRFPGCEILGCCVIGTYPAGRIEELSAHFPEVGRMLYHLQDQEERLYWLDGDKYEGVKGYFVFYEQNQRMQEYLAEAFGEASVEKENRQDNAIRSFREKVKSKTEERSRSFLKLASSFFVAGVLIIGVIVVNRVEDLQRAQVENSLSLAIDSSDTGEVVFAESDQIAAETLPGSDAFWADDEGSGDDVQTTSDAQVSASEQTAASATADAVEAATGTAASDPASTENTAVSTGATDMEASSSDTLTDATVSSDNRTEEADGTAEISVSTESTAVNAEADMSADTEAGSDTDINTAINTDTDTDIGTDTDMDTGTDIGTDTDIESAAEIDTGTNIGTDMDIEAEAAASIDTDINTNTEETVMEAASRQVQAAYVIREGDTLADICARYYGNLERLDELCEANGIEDANLIIPGQKIVLP
ncbi:MAG: LysM peptidoglycan-binding domain-containing protein [Lachnospiraceae bacterium]|nr:LysM peptidoglycan-binding domain-containing protein [Lachnospiraceae bacterium]